MYTQTKNLIAEKNEKKKLLTIKEASELVDGITEYRVRQMCRSGQLPCFKAGRKYLINADKLFKVVFGDEIEIE